MKYFISTFKQALLSMALFTVLLGIIYPYFVWCIGELLFRHEAEGSFLYASDGKILGSELIAQNFTDVKYFHPRPSAAGPDGFDALRSGGSNLGPTSEQFLGLVELRAESYRTINQLDSDTIIPSDAVTASGSGLDPHISCANAFLQAPRVAKARNLSLKEVKNLINRASTKSTFGLFGEKRVNVLTLNLFLDRTFFAECD